MHTSVPRVHQLRHILEHVVDGLNHAALSQHDFVVNGHESVLHVALDAGDDVHPFVPKLAEERVRDIAFVRVKLAEDLVGEGVHHIIVAVVHIGLCEHEVQDLPLFVAQQMQFEANEPAHRAFAFGCHIPEHPHRPLTLVVDHGEACAVHEADACALTEAGKFQEHHQRHEAARHKFDKSVVRDSLWEQVFPMLAHAVQVIMLEVAETVEMECDDDGDDFGLTHSGASLAPHLSVISAKGVSRNFRIKFLAEIVCDTKNFSNFVLCNHSENCLIFALFVI